jgi:hypothetical protein
MLRSCRFRDENRGRGRTLVGIVDVRALIGKIALSAA